jgi:hypothetical protein
MLDHYAGQRAAYDDLAAKKQLPGSILYSEPAYQALHLMDLDRMIAALKTYEARRGAPYATLAVLDANDVTPLALGRTPLPGLTISFDPDRGFPRERYGAMAAALAKADLILVPHCPATPARNLIREAMRPALEGRLPIPIGRCYTGYERASQNVALAGAGAAAADEKPR